MQNTTNSSNDQLYDQLQKQFQRDINSLTDEDRVIRLRGLNNLNKELFNANNNRKAIYELFEKILMRHITRLMDDKVEKHRIIALDILNKFIDNIKNIEHELIISIIKCFVSRMNSIPFPEQSEEIRLNIIVTIRKIIKLGYILAFQKCIADLAFMISKALLDAFPDVKKECAFLISDLANHLKEKLGDNAGVIAKSLVKNLSHQHSRVRKITVESCGELLLSDHAGNQIKEILVHLKQIINDNSLEVRKSSYTVVAKLLNGLAPSILRDYEADLVQLLLNGLSDDNEELAQTCISLLTEVGKNVQKLEMELENGNISDNKPISS